MSLIVYENLFNAALTNKDFEKARELRTANLIAHQIMEPNIVKMNKLTGQPNDPKFMAYALISVLGIV